MKNFAVEFFLQNGTLHNAGHARQISDENNHSFMRLDMQFHMLSVSFTGNEFAMRLANTKKLRTNFLERFMDSVYDISTAATVKETAKGRDVVITMLPNVKIVEAVLTGDNGVLVGIDAGTIIADMSSVLPEHSKHFAELAAQKKIIRSLIRLSAAVSEALVLAQKAAVRDGFAGNMVLDEKAPRRYIRNFKPGWTIAIRACW